MATYRFPVLIWQDFAGRFTACLVDRDERAALARTADEAREQIREYLAWIYQDRPWEPGPDFLDAELATFRVSVRPEYHIDGRPSPCDELVPLTVHCVHGRQEGGLRIAALPLLDVRFYYYEADSLKEMVTRYVQQRLHGVTPREL